jgi:hypothetical protein
MGICLMILVFFYRLLQTVSKYYKDGSLDPIYPITTFQPSEVKEAFPALQAGRRIGASCVSFPRDPTRFPADFSAEDLRFKANRAYLLVGGLGGLGRSAALWLAERGAGHIIFLSRSASEHAITYTGFLEELKALGCSVEVVGGSVAEMTTVEEIVATSPKPIAGVLHAPVVVWV